MVVEIIARVGWKKIACIVGSALFKIALDVISEDVKLKSFDAGAMKFFATHFDDLNFMNKDSI